MIRKITKADKQLYLSLTELMYNSDAVIKPISLEARQAGFAEIMRSNDYLQGYILEFNGESAGYVLTSKMYSQEASGIVLWIEDIFILPEYRSKGLGKQVFEYLENLPNIARFRLEVARNNVRAKSLYERLGYEVLPYTQLIKEL